MSDEIWKSVVGYEGRYEVSDHGRVRSLITGTGANSRKSPDGILSPGNDRGYEKYVLTNKDGKKKSIGGHRLVLEAFVGQHPPNKPHTLHGDGIRNNNHVSNLRWGDYKDNGRDLQRHGTVRGERNPRAKLSDEKVREIKEIYLIGGVTQDTLAKKYGVSRSMICFVLTNRTWKHVL